MERPTFCRSFSARNLPQTTDLQPCATALLHLLSRKIPAGVEKIRE
jgi:hypothetical protein